MTLSTNIKILIFWAIAVMIGFIAGGSGLGGGLILAGGISEDNICQAIHECSPDAVDISSGVESVPGRKDIAKVKSFISKVSTSNSHKKSKDYKLRRIFNV